MKRKIILDCDPGHDDAVAILLALSSQELEVLGITTVYGNVGLPYTSRNAQIMVELAGKTTKVFAGASRPLLRDRISAEDVHGKSGLEGPSFEEPKLPLEQQHAVQFIIDSILEHPNQVTLVPVGAFTNIALAMRLEPKIIPLIGEIVVMGGSTTLGNASPAAEFNILCDPHAASIVFSSGVKLTMFGLNASMPCHARPCGKIQGARYKSWNGDSAVARVFQTGVQQALRLCWTRIARPMHHRVLDQARIVHGTKHAR
jgi:purine nucleosidase